MDDNHDAIIAGCSIVLDSSRASLEEQMAAYAFRGLAYLYKNDLKAAGENFDAAQQLQPSNGPVYLLQGLLSYVKSDYKGAIAKVNKGLELTDKKYKSVVVSAYNLRALSFVAVRRWDEAFQDLEEVLNLDSTAASSNHSIRCMAYQLWGKNDRALQECNVAVGMKATDEEHSEALSQRCAVELDMTLLDQAQKDCSEALRSKSSVPRYVHYLLAKLHLAKGDTAAANTELGAAKSLPFSVAALPFVATSAQIAELETRLKAAENFGGQNSDLSSVATNTSGAVPREPALSHDARLAVQSQLSTLGLYSATVDGNFGPGTRRAIAAFQSANALAATGYLTDQTLDLLRNQAAAKQHIVAHSGDQPQVDALQQHGAEASGVPQDVAVPSDLEPIDAMYVATTPTKIRKTPGVSAPVARSLTAGEHVYVMGKLPDKQWLLVSENDRPIGYVVANWLVPESEFDKQQPKQATGEAASSSTAPSATPPAANGQQAYSGIQFGKYHALVIGNNNYRTLPRLETAEHDANAVADVLQQRYGFEVEKIVDATRADIIAKLADLRKHLTDEDNLLIYFAGHGVYDEAADRGYWLPVDADLDNPANWISNGDITDVVRAIQARHVLIVADSCYSGTLTRGLQVVQEDAGYIRRVVEKRGRTVLTSGGLEPVLDSGAGGHSVFAAALIDVLAANSDVLDGQQLFARLRGAVVVNSEQTPQYGEIRFAGHSGGDFVFVPKQM